MPPPPPRYRVKTGFTLAEVLITLAIIGVVAALTIPTVIKNYQERQVITQLRKAHSSLSQAFNMAIAQNGSIGTWISSNSLYPEKDLVDILEPYLKITKKCGTKVGCFASNAYKTLTGNEMNSSSVWSPSYDSWQKLRLADGTSLLFRNFDINCKYNGVRCGMVFVDINGDKPPNQWGRDLFSFWYTDNGIVPTGIKSDTACSLAVHCANKTSDGICCTGWVIQKDNMDYLRQDVSW